MHNRTTSDPVRTQGGHVAAATVEMIRIYPMLHQRIRHLSRASVSFLMWGCML